MAALPSFHASQAYRAALGLDQVSHGAGSSGQVSGTSSAGGGQFGGLVSDAMSQLREVGGQMETSTAQALSGSGDLIELMTAVSEAEMKLEIVTKVREEVIGAYEKIMRMPV